LATPGEACARTQLKECALRTGEEGEAGPGWEGEEELEPSPADKRKAKIREPFEVPTSGAFWLHDDRYGDSTLESAEPAK
jgi:hypothetical protein